MEDKELRKKDEEIAASKFPHILPYSLENKSYLDNPEENYIFESFGEEWSASNTRIEINEDVGTRKWFRINSTETRFLYCEI